MPNADIRIRTRRVIRFIRIMKIVEIGNKHYKCNEDLEIVYEVYWNETFEEWTPVLWNLPHKLEV